MPFNIKDHPFYHAVMQFEEINHDDPKQVQEVFDAFLALSKEYNVYAAHYLNYLIENREKLRLVVPTEDDFLKDFQEYFAQLPTIDEPQKWCEASQLIVLYRNESTSASQKEESRRKLKKMVDAPNAIVFLIIVSPGTKKKELLRALLRNRNIYSLYHLKLYLLEEELSSRMKTEYEFIEKIVGITTNACFRAGKIEGLLANFWISNSQKASNSVETMEKSIQDICEDIYAKNSISQDTNNRIGMFKIWLITSAFMGDANACFMLMKYSGSNALNFTFIENNHHERLIFLSARQGSRSAQLECGHIHFKNQKYLTAAHFLKMGVEEAGQKATLIDKTTINSSIATAHAKLALMHDMGMGGVEKNDEFARKHYIAAGCEGIHAYIYNSTGQVNFIEDIEVAVKKLESEIKRLTEENSIHHKIQIARYHTCIGILYFRRGRMQDHSKIFKHFKISADLGDVVGMQQYAGALESGMGCEVDKKGALEYYVKSAREGNPLAKWWILRQYAAYAIRNPSEIGLTKTDIAKYIDSTLQNFLLPGEVEPEAVRGICYARLGNKEMAYAAFREGAEKQCATSLAGLGQIYEGLDPEFGVPEDVNKAYQCYDTAARLGDITALYYKGSCLLRGYGVPKNVIEAKKLFEEALGKGNIVAAFGLAEIYGKGHGVDIDYKLALKYLHMAEPTNQPVVLDRLGEYYSYGHGCTSNIEKSLSYSERSCNLGSSVGTYYYVRMKLWQEWRENRLNEPLLRDLLEKISRPTNQGYAASQFLRTIIHLLLDPTQLPKALDEIKKRVAEKPHKRSQIMLDHLIGKRGVNSSELFLLLFGRDPAKALQELETLKPEESTDSATTSISSSTSSRSDRRSDATQVERDTARNAAKVKRVAEKVQQLRDPKNKKFVSFERFRQLFGEIAVLAEEEGMTFEERLSKGSNHQFTMMSPTGDVMSTLSFHPIHKPGQGSHHDPNRVRSLQASIQGMAQAIPSLANIINDRENEGKLARDQFSMSSSSTTASEDEAWSSSSHASGTHSSSSSSSSRVWLPQSIHHANRSGINTSSSSSTSIGSSVQASNTSMSSSVNASVSTSSSSSSNTSTKKKGKGKGK